MDNNLYIILDCHFLCYRALFTTGDLSYKDIKTGVVYGFLRDLVSLQEHFRTNNFLFCFDYGVSKRKKIYPEYKANRKKPDITEEEKKVLFAFRQQIAKLREEYLPAIGFNNIFYQKGYEADDIIAVLCKDVLSYKKNVIVSADGDLFQLVTANTIMWNPITKKETTLQTLTTKYDFTGPKWWQVKALAGCPSDNIKGVKGVGEKTAIKFLQGRLPTHHKTYRTIMNEGEAVYHSNKKLTRLPFSKCNTPTISPNKFSNKGWQDVLEVLGMESMKGRNPFLSVRGTHGKDT